MPDHLHLLIGPIKTTISEVMRSIKTNVSRDINRYIHSASPGTRAMERGEHGIAIEFAWQEKFYDHIITDDEDLINHVEYIRYNPVKAGLVEKPEDYPFLYVDDKMVSRALGFDV